MAGLFSDLDLADIRAALSDSTLDKGLRFQLQQLVPPPREVVVELDYNKANEFIEQQKEKKARALLDEHPLKSGLKRFLPPREGEGDDDEDKDGEDDDGWYAGEDDHLGYSTRRFFEKFERGVGREELVDEGDAEGYDGTPGSWYPKTADDKFFFAEKFVQLRAARMGHFGLSAGGDPGIDDPVIGPGCHPEQAQRATYRTRSEPRGALLRDWQDPPAGELPEDNDEDEADTGFEGAPWEDRFLPEFLVPRRADGADRLSARENPHRKLARREGEPVRPPRPDEASDPVLEGGLYCVSRRAWEEFDLPPPGALWKARDPRVENVRYDMTVMRAVKVPLVDDGGGGGGGTAEVKIPSILETRPGGPRLRWVPAKVTRRSWPGIVVLYQASPPAADATRWREVKINIEAGELRHLFEEANPSGDDDDDDAAMAADRVVPGSPLHAFQNENRILSRLDMTGSRHVVQPWRPTPHRGTLVATEHIAGGPLAVGGQTDLLSVWRLLECLGKALSVMAYGSEDPGFPVKGWQPIVQFDWSLENIFRGDQAILIGVKGGQEVRLPKHSCGHRESCFKLRHFEQAALVPDELEQPEEYKRFRQAELLGPWLKYLGRVTLPEQRWVPPTAETVDDLHMKTQAGYFGPWSNIYLLGRLVQSAVLPSLHTPLVQLLPGEVLDLEHPWRPALYEHVGHRDLANRARDASFLEHVVRGPYYNEAAPPPAINVFGQTRSRARLDRLLAWCTRERCEERPTVEDFMVEVARGAAEMGERAYSPAPGTWTVQGQERLQAEHAALVEQGLRAPPPPPPPPPTAAERAAEDEPPARGEPKDERAREQAEILRWLATGGREGSIKGMNLFGYDKDEQPAFAPGPGEQYRSGRPGAAAAGPPEARPQRREGDFDPRRARVVPEEEDEQGGEEMTGVE